ncbi:MAG: FHA domain-containing protein, partial [Planctomycetaceae bacterium]
MANLEIRYPSQPPEKRKLSKDQPLLIGRSLTSDVQIDDESVAPMHCRISWNRDAYEVSAGSTDGVDLNGTLVRRSLLRPGDLLRIGPVDIQFHSGDKAPSSREPKSEPPGTSIELKPVSMDDVPSSMRRARESKWTPEVPVKPLSPPPNLSQVFDDSGPIQLAKGATQDSKSSKREKPASDSQKRAEPTEGENAPLDDDAHAGIVISRTRSSEEEYVEPAEPRQPRESIAEKLKKHRVQARPGEEDTLRSPFVLGLSGSALALLLIGTVFYLVIGRESAQRAFDAGYNEYQQSKFTQAIELFEKFLATHPRHDLAPHARELLWQSRVEKEISGGAPNWKLGHQGLLDAIQANRDLEHSDDRILAYRTFAE